MGGQLDNHRLLLEINHIKGLYELKKSVKFGLMFAIGFLASMETRN
jgi:hypothetical protein